MFYNHEIILVVLTFYFSMSGPVSLIKSALSLVTKIEFPSKKQGYPYFMNNLTRNFT